MISIPSVEQVNIIQVFQKVFQKEPQIMTTLRSPSYLYRSTIEKNSPKVYIERVHLSIYTLEKCILVKENIIVTYKAEFSILIRMRTQTSNLHLFC